jgi:hypothetical protein
MKVGERVSPDDMVATFLTGEINSPRNGARIEKQLAIVGKTRELVDRLI